MSDKEKDSFENIQERLITYQGEDRYVHFTEYLIEKAGDISNHQTFRSSFTVFDKLTDGLETGEVVVITGHTKNGKTLFAESWLLNLSQCNKNAKIGIFSFEVQTEKLLLKYMNLPQMFLYVPRQLKTMDFAWLRDRILEAKLKFGCNIFLIDHLHFLVDMSTKQNMSLNIGAFMRRLKQDIAINLNVAIILIAHQGQPKDNQEASLNNIRDSSFISQEADTVIIVSRRKNLSNVDIKDYLIKYGEDKLFKITPPAGSDDEYSANLAIIKVAVCRRTGVFDAKKLFKKVGHFMEEI